MIPEMSERSTKLRARVQEFMDEHIMPNESLYYQQIEEADDRWACPPILDELKAKAKERASIGPEASQEVSQAERQEVRPVVKASSQVTATTAESGATKRLNARSSRMSWPTKAKPVAKEARVAFEQLKKKKATRRRRLKSSPNKKEETGRSGTRTLRNG